jgi:hypothetical protein
MKYIFEFTKEKVIDGYDFVLKINLEKFDEYYHGHPYDYICNQLWLGARPNIVERKTEDNILYWNGNIKTI